MKYSPQSKQINQQNLKLLIDNNKTLMYYQNIQEVG